MRDVHIHPRTDKQTWRLKNAPCSHPLHVTLCKPISSQWSSKNRLSIRMQGPFKNIPIAIERPMGIDMQTGPIMTSRLHPALFALLCRHPVFVLVHMHMCCLSLTTSLDLLHSTLFQPFYIFESVVSEPCCSFIFNFLSNQSSGA